MTPPPLRPPIELASGAPRDAYVLTLPRFGFLFVGGVHVEELDALLSAAVDGLEQCALALTLHGRFWELCHQAWDATAGEPPSRTRVVWDGTTFPAMSVTGLPFMTARCFVFGLDQVRSSIDRGVRAGVIDKKCLDAFDAEPSLAAVKSIRDSLHHVEDRTLGKVRDKPLPPGPDPALQELNLGTLGAEGFTVTGADGHPKTLAVEEAPLRAAERVVADILATTTWQ